MEIDFTSTDFIFVSNHGEYYIEGQVKCVGDYTEWRPTKKIKDGWGMFQGLTMVTFKGYDGVLPRLDEDTCSFSEFSIYYKSELINDITFFDLTNKIKSDKRSDKINHII